MLQLTQVEALPKQQILINLENGESFVFYLEYLDGQEYWYCNIDYIPSDDESNPIRINYLKLNYSFNILSQYKNLLPFGIMVIGDTVIDPFASDDFSSGRFKIYILNEEEVARAEELYTNG